MQPNYRSACLPAVKVCNAKERAQGCQRRMTVAAFGDNKPARRDRRQNERYNRALMRRKWTRRKFLEGGLKGSIAIRAGGVAAAPVAAAAGPAPQTSKRAIVPPLQTRELLRAAMDEIVPASDGMPAASEVGCLEYFDKLFRSTPALQRRFEQGTALIERIATRFEKGFTSLARAERIEVLRELEQRVSPAFFSDLRDYVYEAYYTRPQVWKLIGYELHPTHQTGPRMKPFDEKLLAQVRHKPRLYREVK